MTDWIRNKEALLKTIDGWGMNDPRSYSRGIRHKSEPPISRPFNPKRIDVNTDSINPSIIDSRHKVDFSKSPYEGRSGPADTGFLPPANRDNSSEGLNSFLSSLLPGLSSALPGILPGLALSSNPLAMLAATAAPMVLGEIFRGNDPNAERTNQLIDMRESAIKDVLAQAKGEAGATQRSPSQIAADRARQQNLAGGKGKGFQKQLAYFSEEGAGRDIEARRLAGKQLTVQAASAMKDLIEERKKMSQGYQADVAGIGKILASLLMPETLANQQARLGLLDPDTKVPKVNTNLPGQTIDSQISLQA